MTIFERDDVCRQHPLHSEVPCPGCGFVSRKLPPWATYGAVFALDGRAYRILGVGSSNGRHERHLHFDDTVVVEPVRGEHWQLPDTPCPVAAFDDAMKAMRRLPRFDGVDLARAMVAVSDKGA